MTEVRATQLCAFPCRCGGEISLANSEENGGEALALHTLSHCAWFEGADKDALLDECEKHPEAWAEFVGKVLD